MHRTCEFIFFFPNQYNYSTLIIEYICSVLGKEAARKSFESLENGDRPKTEPPSSLDQHDSTAGRLGQEGRGFGGGEPSPVPHPGRFFRALQHGQHTGQTRGLGEGGASLQTGDRRKPEKSRVPHEFG